VICPKCGKDNPAESMFCNNCGSKLPSAPTSIYCPYCGAPGQEYQFNCTKCGKELPKDLKGSASGRQLGSVSTRLCPNCGRSMSIYDAICPFCGAVSSDTEGYADGSYLSDTPSASYHESELPVLGGVLILIAGVLGIIEGLLTLGAVSTLSSAGYSVSGYATCCGLLMGLFGLIAIFGGYSSIKREGFAFAIVGGVLGIFAVGFFLGALLSLIGTVIVAIAHREYSG
jgi:hypothetical protein